MIFPTGYHQHVPLMGKPTIVDRDADLRFRALLREVMPTTYDWENQYVEHEMTRIRHVFQPAICGVDGRQVLEFGCNIGATAIVLAHLGGRTTACDVNHECLTLAQMNARRYGSLASIRFVQTAEGACLPFADESFDVITCNSVLEYVRAGHLEPLLKELDRVLRNGGDIVIFGTSNRLWPIEAHSGRWFVNYMPAAVDRLRRRNLQRGVWPHQIRRVFKGYFDVLGHRSADEYMTARNAARSARSERMVLKLLASAAGKAGISPGFLTPFMFVVLRKPSAKTA